MSSDSLAAQSLSQLGKERAWFTPKPLAFDTFLNVVSLLVRSP
jgi:hypothetical protein